ncbi:MAG: hypothetical protein ACYS6W_10085 [Planctomycetota bacterium]|jgi:hypothetical protein
MKMGGWSNIETVLKYYLKSSDENKEKKPEAEYACFRMRGLDVENLMKVAPRVKQMEME